MSLFGGLLCQARDLIEYENKLAEATLAAAAEAARHLHDNAVDHYDGDGYQPGGGRHEGLGGGGGGGNDGNDGNNDDASRDSTGSSDGSGSVTVSTFASSWSSLASCDREADLLHLGRAATIDEARRQVKELEKTHDRLDTFLLLLGGRLAVKHRGILSHRGRQAPFIPAYVHDPATFNPARRKTAKADAKGGER